MTNNTYNGWILHKRWSGDTSVIATFFTREKGLIRCMYKGGRTTKKQAQLQPFTPLWLSIDERGQWSYARQVESSGSALDLQGSALFSALYLNELLYYALKPADPHERLYDAYQQCINQLVDIKDKQALEAQLRRFEWTLLDCCGYAMSFTQEARTNTAINPEHAYQFIAGEGFLRTEQGIAGKHLLALATDNLNDPAILKTAKFIMRKALNHLLDGREIKARALFASCEF